MAAACEPTTPQSAFVSWRQKGASSFPHISQTLRSCCRPLPRGPLLPAGPFSNLQFITSVLQSIKIRRTTCCSDSCAAVTFCSCRAHKRNVHARCNIDMFFCQRSQTTHLILPRVCACVCVGRPNCWPCSNSELQLEIRRPGHDWCFWSSHTDLTDVFITALWKTG